MQMFSFRQNFSLAAVSICLTIMGCDNSSDKHTLSYKHLTQKSHILNEDEFMNLFEQELRKNKSFDDHVSFVANLGAVTVGCNADREAASAIEVYANLTSNQVRGRTSEMLEKRSQLILKRLAEHRGMSTEEQCAAITHDAAKQDQLGVSTLTLVREATRLLRSDPDFLTTRLITRIEQDAKE